MTALKLAIEFDEDYIYSLGEEADLKPLSRLPQFKKWLKQGESDK